MRLSGNKSTYVTIAGRDYLYFGGSNYLGLAQRDELWKAAGDSFAKYGFSSGASRLTSGENELLLSLEKLLADFAGADEALVLPAGFLANQVVLEAVDEMIDVWVIHSNAHASIHAAVRQSKKPVIVGNISRSIVSGVSWRDQLEIDPLARLGLFAEEIDPLTGTMIDLSRLLKDVNERDFVIIDEAHSFGVLGKKGGGVLQHYGIEAADNLIRTGTFSKALGTYGGFVLACAGIISLIKEHSLCFKGSTTLPPVLCAATSASLRLLRDDPASTLTRLRHNMDFLNQVLAAEGFNGFLRNIVPIYYLHDVVGVQGVLKRLFDCGICIPAMRNYFAGQASLGLRFTIQSGHSKEELRRLVDALSSFCEAEKGSD